MHFYLLAENKFIHLFSWFSSWCCSPISFVLCTSEWCTMGWWMKEIAPNETQISGMQSLLGDMCVSTDKTRLALRVSSRAAHWNRPQGICPVVEKATRGTQREASYTLGMGIASTAYHAAVQWQETRQVRVWWGKDSGWHGAKISWQKTKSFVC